MRRVSPRQWLTPATVLAAAIILSNLALFATWTAPRWSARLGVTGGGGGAAAAQQRLDPALQRVRRSYGRLAAAEDDLQALRDRLIAGAGGAELLGMLGAAGHEVGIPLQDATLQYAPIEELGVLQLGITYPVAGSYPSLRALLDRLTALPVFLVIDGVGLQSFAQGGADVGIDLALSVFLDDTELGGAARPVAGAAPARPVVSERELALLRAALARDDPADIADAALAVLAALPELPVDPAALVVELAALETTPAASTPRRDPFAVVLPPPPPAPEVVEQPDVFIAPEPVLPVRLVGVVRIDGRFRASLYDDNDDRLFVVAAGDTIANGVEIIDVGADYAEVSFRDNRTVLRLEGTRP
jgi:hypothetical protein